MLRRWLLRWLFPPEPEPHRAFVCECGQELWARDPADHRATVDRHLEEHRP